MGMIDGFTNLIFNVYEAFTVALFIKHRENLKCVSHVSFANSFDKNKNVPVEGSLPGWVMKHNEPLIIPNFDKDESTLGYYGNPEGIKSFMGFPVENKGVIVVDSKKKWVFTDKEKKILKSFVTVIHEEIENERRFFDMEEKLDELNTERRILNLFNVLNQSKISVNEIFKECINLSRADFCFVGIERNEKMFVHDVIGTDNKEYIKKECPTGSSIASVVMEGGRELLLPHSSRFLSEKPLFFPGEMVKVKQFFGFPLIISDVTFGMVGFVSLSDNNLKDQTIGFLRNVSTLLSLYYSSLWMRENLEKLKDFEPVTDALQFPVFLEISDKIIKRSEKFSLLSIKLPGIKPCNKLMGLDFTNKLLKKVFHIIKNCTGTRAYIARKGGGHFCALLKDSDVNEVNGILRVLHYSIAKGLAEEKVDSIMNDVEIGISYFPEDSADIWGLLDKADHNKLIFKNK
jgi:GGDEF domain-containing protein